MVRADRVYLGVDVGTSGVRGSRSTTPARWWPRPRHRCRRRSRSTAACVRTRSCGGRPRPRSSAHRRGGPEPRIDALAVDGTSGTLLVDRRAGHAARARRHVQRRQRPTAAARIAEVAPPESGAHGATSPLARLLAPAGAPARGAPRPAPGRLDRGTPDRAARRQRRQQRPQARLRPGDPRRWPDWLDRLGVRRELLPEVVAPGTALGPDEPRMAAASAWHRAAPSSPARPTAAPRSWRPAPSAAGDGVTALGTTLTLKLLSDRPVFSPPARRLQPPHRRPLAGRRRVEQRRQGAAALPHAGAMAELVPRLRPDRPTGLHWHPLPGPGERFPVADPTLAFEPEPLPTDEAILFQGLLEGIAEVEERAYRLLTELGAPPLRSVRTVGGAPATSPGWTSAPGCSACRCCRPSISRPATAPRSWPGAPREAAWPDRARRLLGTARPRSRAGAGRRRQHLAQGRRPALGQGLRPVARRRPGPRAVRARGPGARARRRRGRCLRSGHRCRGRGAQPGRPAALDRDHAARAAAAPGRGPHPFGPDHRPGDPRRRRGPARRAPRRPRLGLDPLLQARPAAHRRRGRAPAPAGPPTSWSSAITAWSSARRRSPRADALLREVERRLDGAARAAAGSAGSAAPSPAGARPCPRRSSTRSALDPARAARACSGSLYPDHVIFLGPAATPSPDSRPSQALSASPASARCSPKAPARAPTSWPCASPSSWNASPPRRGSTTSPPPRRRSC